MTMNMTTIAALVAADTIDLRIMPNGDIIAIGSYDDTLPMVWDDAVRALAAAEQEEIERELFIWLEDPANADDPEYSDIFKYVYGFRPRW